MKKAVKVSTRYSFKVNQEKSLHDLKYYANCSKERRVEDYVKGTTRSFVKGRSSQEK